MADPYNTTVHVGGLSPLISVEDLRNFFAPFGDLHSVKVPVGKHYGLVHFVRKDDAERAIEKMQGFSICGSRIRLNWGTSEYDGHAAAQAAQVVALRAHSPSVQRIGSNGSFTQGQVIQSVQNIATQKFISQHGQPQVYTSYDGSSSHTSTNYTQAPSSVEEKLCASLGSRNGSSSEYVGHCSDERQENPFQRMRTVFSPFSPDLDVPDTRVGRHLSVPVSRSNGLPHPSKGCAPGFYPSAQDPESNSNGTGSNGTLNILSQFHSTWN